MKMGIGLVVISRTMWIWLMQKQWFDVGKHIDISSTYLLDILSDHPVQPTAAHGGSLIPKVVADQVATSSSTPMEDEREEWS